MVIGRWSEFKLILVSQWHDGSIPDDRKLMSGDVLLPAATLVGRSSLAGPKSKFVRASAMDSPLRSLVGENQSSW